MKGDTIRPAFEGVLVDLYGTLIPAAPREVRAPHLHEMGRILEIDPVRFEHDWVGRFGPRLRGQMGSLEVTIRTIAGLQGALPSDAHVHRTLEVCLAFTRAQFEACGPVLPDLDALRAAGLRMVVVSDASEEAPRLWPSTQLSTRFDGAVFSCEEGFCKPDPGMYHRALRKIGLPPERCAFVGDGGSHELTGATAVGLAAFLYRFPGDSMDSDPRYAPDTEWRGPPLARLRDLLTAPHPSQRRLRAPTERS